MKKRIAVIGLKGLPAFGGAAAVGENLMDQMKDRYDFTVYAVSSHSNVKGEYKGFRQYVIRKFPVDKLNVFYYYFVSALHAVLFGKYDIIHLHHIDGAFILYILKLKYKVISTSHGRIYLYDKWSPLVKKFFIRNEKTFLKYSDIVVSVSSDIADYYRTVTDREIHFIPNGVNLDMKYYSPSVIEEEGFLLFAAGRILSEKGCHVLLEALIRIKYKGKLLVIGNLNHVLSYKEKLLKLASSLDVEFIDLIKDKALLMTYIKKAKLFVFPSSREAMSMMLLEVTTIKTPLICSDIPENKAVFNDNEVLFFETDNAEDLAEKLTFAMNYPEKMKALSDIAYQTLEKKYQWKDLAEQYSELYDRILV